MHRKSTFSSVRGRIGMLLMAASDTPQYHRVLAMLTALPPHARLVVWTNSRAERTALEQWLRHRGVHQGLATGEAEKPLPADFRCLLVSPEHRTERYSHWLRDPLLLRWESPTRVRLLRSNAGTTEDDWRLAAFVAGLNFNGQPRLELAEEPLPVAGGNLLCDVSDGDGFVLVGYNEFRGVDPDPERGEALLLGLLNGKGAPVFSRLIALGKGAKAFPQLLPHIDLYIALTGCRRGPGNRYVALLAECVEAPHPEGSDLGQLEGHQAGANRYLDSVENELQEAGFEVVRTPMPILRSPAARRPYLCPYNNCLVEHSGDAGRTVWIPRFSHAQEVQPWHSTLLESEARVAEIWGGLDFDVRFVEADFHDALDDRGALRCMTQEIIRL